MNFLSRVFLVLMFSLFVGVSLGEVFAGEESSEMDYYKKACDSGDATACFELGYLFENGMGMSQNKREALLYYQKACDLKYQFGCESLVRLKTSQQ